MFCIHIYHTYSICIIYLHVIYIWVTWFFFLFCYSATTTVVLKCVLGFIFQAPPTEDDVEMPENVLEGLWLQRSSQLSNSGVRWVQLRGNAFVAIGKERNMRFRVQGVQAKRLSTPEDFDVWNFLFLMLQFFWRINPNYWWENLELISKLLALNKNWCLAKQVKFLS